MSRLLAIALIGLTAFPIVIFATDFTNSRVLRAARERAVGPDRKQSREENDQKRRDRQRDRRATVHPSTSRIVQSVLYQLVLLTVVAFAARWLFALRL